MLLAPPEIVETTAYARLPDELKLKRGEMNEWGRGQPIGLPERSLLEGPSFDHDDDGWPPPMAR